MKTLQYESTTTSPKDMYKGKERKKGKSVKISLPVGPCDETWLFHSLGQSGDCRLDPLGSEGSPEEVVGKSPWDNPQNTKSTEFILRFR